MKLTYRDSDEGEPNLKERQSQSIQRINMGPIVHDKKERDAQLEENSNGSGICSKLSRCEMEAIKLDSTSISTCVCVCVCVWSRFREFFTSFFVGPG